MSMKLAVLLTVALFGCVVVAQDEMAPGNWGYDAEADGRATFDYSNPAAWGAEFPKCGTGKITEAQSPVDISTIATADATLAALLPSYEAQLRWTITNNGHTLTGSPPADLASRLRLSGGPLGNDTFILANVHFHWGKTNFEGSEHALFGRKSAMETHIVHYNSKYGSLANALENSDGLAVIGIFSDISSIENKAPIKEASAAVKGFNAVTTFKDTTFNPAEILPADLGYYTYKGSLTTPECQESVTWIVLNGRATVSNEQLESLRNMTGHVATETIESNFRPIQKLNSRIIRSFGVATASSTSKDNGLSDGAIAGIVIGSVVGGLLIIGGAAFAAFSTMASKPTSSVARSSSAAKDASLPKKKPSQTSETEETEETDEEDYSAEASASNSTEDYSFDGYSDYSASTENTV